MGDTEKKATLTMVVNGQAETCEIECMTVRHPATGARFDVKMDPLPKVPMNIMVVGHTTAQVEEAVKAIMTGSGYTDKYASDVALEVAKRLGADRAEMETEATATEGAR